MKGRRRLGQHFLADGRIARAVAEALPASPPRVLEIGPGKGALTRELLRRFPRVMAVELDRQLAAGLTARLAEPEGLDVVVGDALAFDPAALDSTPWLVAGNLPYSVATPIIRRVLGWEGVWAAAVFMIQHEVAARLVAAPGERPRGLLTLEVEAFAQAELLFTVPPRCFLPPPRVLSAVVRFTPRAAGQRPSNVRRVLAVAAAAFTHRRKKLVNALGDLVDRPTAAAALVAAGIAAEARAEDLALADWLRLAACLPGASEGA